MRQYSSRHSAPHLAPLAGRGRIASAIRVRGSLRKRGDNCFKYARQVVQNVIVPESQDAIVVRSKPFVANGVALVIRMLSAVNFDNKASFATNKVDSVGANRFLPDEFVTSQPTRPQTIPELIFRIRRYATQATRALRPEFVSTSHAETPPHPSCSARRPLPASGERRRPAA